MRAVCARRVILSALLIAPLLSARTPAGAQSRDDDAPPRTVIAPEDGFFPTPRMIDFAINRITEELAGQLALDDEQLDHTRSVVRARIPVWLAENRPEIKSLINEFIEGLLGDSAPSPDSMALWAARTMPLVEEFKGLMEECVAAISPALTDEQAVILEGDLAAFRVGVSFTQAKLQSWKEGGFDPDVDWPRGPRHEEAARREAEFREQEEELARQQVISGGTPPPTSAAEDADEHLPSASRPASRDVDAWERYVLDYAAYYKLDAAQEDSAMRFLREAQRRRDRYQIRTLPELQRIEQSLRESPSPEERKRLQAEYERLTRPIRHHFQQLQDRLDKLPTRKQRVDAATGPGKPPVAPFSAESGPRGS